MGINRDLLIVPVSALSYDHENDQLTLNVSEQELDNMTRTAEGDERSSCSPGSVSSGRRPGPSWASTRSGWPRRWSRMPGRRASSGSSIPTA